MSLDTFHDTPEVLKDYASTYKTDEDDSASNMPEWVFVCGNEEEVDTLRKEVGVYDLDPVIDADLTQHAGILSFGNDRTNRWAAVPSTLKPADIVEAIRRIAGSRFRDPKYAVGEITESETWRMRGPLIELDAFSRQLSVMGFTVNIPKRLPILGTEGISGRNLTELYDFPQTKCVRGLSPSKEQTPGTVVAVGGRDRRGNLVVEKCYLEMARHLLGGVLQLDAKAQPRINGIPVRENPDLRFPMIIVDAMGNVTGGQALKSSLGHAATAEGYFHQGTFYATILQVALTPALEHNGSSVQVHKACARDRSKHLRVIGTTSLTWVDSDVEILDSVTRQVLGGGRIRKRRGERHGRFVVDCKILDELPHFVSARITGDSETVQSKNQLVAKASICRLPGPNQFLLQGPIEDLDVTKQTITVNGATVTIPDELNIDGTNHITGSTLERLADPTGGGNTRTLLASAYNSGYLFRLQGNVSTLGDRRRSDVATSTGGSYTASTCAIETKEVAITGTLESFDPEHRLLVVNGLTIFFNNDNRFGFAIQDTAGKKISPEIVSAQCQQLVGSQITVNGYSHIFRSPAVGTEYRPVQGQIYAVDLILSASVDRRTDATAGVDLTFDRKSLEVSANHQ